MSIEEISGMNIAEIIVHHGTDSSIKGKPFIMFRDEQGEMQSITYGDYYQKSLAYGNMIHQLKREHGEKISERFHVGVFMQNIPEFFYILGGCAFTDSTLVGVNNAQVGDKLAFDINTIDIKVLFVDSVEQPGTGGTFLVTVLQANKTVGFAAFTKEYILLAAKGTGNDNGSIEDIPETLQKYSSSLSEFKPIELDVSNAGVIIFTSGTTGIPKGIEVSWKKLIDVGMTATNILKYTEQDVGYVCMPINHSNSLYLNIMPALINGAKLLTRRRFSVSNFVKDIEEVGATVWNCVGDPVQYLINYISSTVGKDADYSHLPLRTVISTGTNAANRAVFTGMFGLEIFKEVYGSTEAGAITAVDENTPEYSVGKLVKDVRVIHEETLEECVLAEVDEQGKILNLDTSAGEIIVSQTSLGASAFTGYYKLTEESSDKICSIKGEDFYRLGDLGAIVEKNGVKYLVFLGRTGDWVRYKGENWAPIDGEKLITTFEGITSAGIIGVPQSTGKEDDPMYVLEVNNPAEFDIKTFYSFCQKKVPRYMIPRFIRLVTNLPMTETMKLKKTILKRNFFYRSSTLDADGNDSIYEIVQGTVKEFREEDYKAEIALYTDPTNQATLKAFTKRSDLF